MSQRSGRLMLGALLACAALVLTACGPSKPTVTPTPPAPSSSVPAPSLPAGFASRMDGSTATIPLGQAVLKSLVGTDEGMTFNTTDNAYQNLIKGTKDLILVTYPSADEQAAAAKAGVKLDVIPVVKDALVFLANTGNPVSNLTQQQVKDIYTGKTTDWGQVGGKPGSIIPYQRPVNSGSQTLFLKLAMAGTTPMDAPQQLRPQEMSGLVDDVANTDSGPDALGYSFLYYATQMYLKNSAKLLAIDGVAPSAQTVSDGTYPYGTYYYAVMRDDTPADSPARGLVAWLLGDAGQRIASAANYVPLSPRNIVAPAAPTYYLGATADNTTQSSGTGGTQRRDTTVSRNVPGLYCTENGKGNVTGLSIPGNPEVNKAVVAWATQQVAKGGTVGCYQVVEMGSLVSVQGGDDGAVFDEATGKQLQLSDLFYDKVNYISFINDNLLNQWTNQALQNEVNEMEPGFDLDNLVTTPFTGIPNDYASFTVDASDMVGAPTLEICFPQGNPFTTTLTVQGQQTPLSCLPLRLPANLSPYGVLWDFDQATAPGKKGVMLPSVTTAFPGPGANDAAINAAIQTAYASAPQAASTEVDLYGTRLSVVFWDQPNVTYWQPGRVEAMTTVDLATGQSAPFGPSDIPANWWKQPGVQVTDETASGADNPTPPNIDGYVPPAGTTYRNVRLGYAGMAYFEAVEPSGRVLSVMTQPA